LIKYIKYSYIFDIVKNINDKFANKPATINLIVCNGKISTNNMIKLKCINVCV